MDKDAVLRAIDGTRDGWESVIADLGPEGLERPGATGDWRVRDVLAHISCWDRWQLVQLRCAFTGETPSDEELNGGLTFPENDDVREDAMNAMFLAGTKDLPLDEVVRRWREVAAMRRDWAGAATQEQHDALIGADWGSGTNRIIRLASEVPSVSNRERAWERLMAQVGHEHEHLGIVRGWMASQLKAPRQ